MQYITLGKTNLSISILGVGGIPLQRFDAQNAKDIFSTISRCNNGLVRHQCP